MAVKPTRGFQISGVPMIDPKGRWYLLHVTGERPIAPMELGLTQAPLADGMFFPRERGRLGSSQMALQLHVTDAGRGHGGRTQRDRNLADLYNALQVGRETTVSMMIAGQLCSQRCIVTAGSLPHPHPARGSLEGRAGRRASHRRHAGHPLRVHRPGAPHVERPRPSNGPGNQARRAGCCFVGRQPTRRCPASHRRLEELESGRRREGMVEGSGPR